MKKRPLLFIATAVSCSGALAAAGTIGFETVPGFVPFDQLAISNQYIAAYGVAFITTDGSTPYLEAVGGADAGNGFVNNVLNLPDTAAVGYEARLGRFFLRLGTLDLLTAPVPSLIISYVTPVAAASAQIWDIDGNSFGTEQWRVDALGSGGNTIQTIFSPIGIVDDGSSLDGKPWTWSFDQGATTDIYSIKITFIGSKTSDIGLAFDNFSPSSAAASIPEASVSLLFLVGLPPILFKVRRYRVKERFTTSQQML